VSLRQVEHIALKNAYTILTRKLLGKRLRGRQDGLVRTILVWMDLRKMGCEDETRTKPFRIVSSDVIS
jgi:hypothetical protein